MVKITPKVNAMGLKQWKENHQFTESLDDTTQMPVVYPITQNLIMLVNRQAEDNFTLCQRSCISEAETSLLSTHGPCI